MKRMRTYIVLGTTVLLSSCLFISSGWAAARDVISFISQKGADIHLTLMNTRGEIRQSILTDLERPSDFTWSPHGGSIAYSTSRNRNFDIYVMDVVRREADLRLTFDATKDLSPAWSPNGKWIAFISERAGSRDIYRIDIDGRNLMQLTKQKGGTKPAWSPDSQSIAFVSTSLFVMSANGKGLKHLADATSMGCSWSPDGRQIAFISKGAEGGMDIFSIDVNGKNLHQLTWLDHRTFIAEPVWSPSGEWIAYVLSEVIGPLKPVLGADDFAEPVVCIVNAIDGGVGKPIEATRGLVLGSTEWVPKVLLSVSPSDGQQTTLWSRLKQTGK